MTYFAARAARALLLGGSLSVPGKSCMAESELDGGGKGREWGGGDKNNLKNGRGWRSCSLAKKV